MKNPAALAHRQNYLQPECKQLLSSVTLSIYSDNINNSGVKKKTQKIIIMNEMYYSSSSQVTGSQASDAKDGCSKQETPQKVRPIASLHQLRLQSGL